MDKTFTEYQRVTINGPVKTFETVKFPPAAFTQPDGLNRQAALNLLNEWNRISVARHETDGVIQICTL